MKTMNPAIQKLSSHFKKFEKYVTNPPDEQILGWILHYMKKYDYETILKVHGIRYLLIVMDLLEKEEDFELCSKIIKVIEAHNAENLKDYPTHISKMTKA